MLASYMRGRSQLTVQYQISLSGVISQKGYTTVLKTCSGCRSLLHVLFIFPYLSCLHRWCWKACWGSSGHVGCVCGVGLWFWMTDRQAILFALNVISWILVILRKRFIAVFQEGLLVTLFLPFRNNPHREILFCFL